MSDKLKRIFLCLGAIFLSVFLSINIISTPVSAVPSTSNTANNTSNTPSTPTQNTSPVENPVENSANNSVENSQNPTQTTQNTTQNTQNTQNPTNTSQNTTQTDTNTSTSTNSETSDASSSEESGKTINTCYDESGSLGWFVCPTTGFLAKVTDSIYGIIEDFLIISPISTETNSPYHQVWSIFRDITNVVFVIFFLIVIYSQLTGAGISNYGIKKALPKIIVSAILINLSFIICALLVDVSNILGVSLRGLFSNIESSITATGILASAGSSSSSISYSALAGGLAGGTAIAGLAIGATGGFGYLFFSLLAVLLGAVVSILIAFVTIATRQAFIYILIMISPLAFVCYLLPNTESWFNKWKSSLLQMLFFFPMFAALFGACSLVGWVIIASAETPLMIILGMAVKVVPLFAAWNLLKMSGTLPGQINSALSNFASKPVGAGKAMLGERAALRRARYFGETAKPYQYNRRLNQFLQEGRFKRLSDIKTYEEASAIRAQEKTARLTNSNGTVTRRARAIQRIQTQNLRNRAAIVRTEKNADEGLSSITSPNAKNYSKLLKNDLKIMHAADQLAMETSDAETVRYNNAVGRHERFSNAINAHVQSSLYGRTVDPEALSRYNRMLAASRGDHDDVRYIAADAAQSRAVEDKIRTQKFDTYFRTLPPTQNLYDQLVTMTGEGHKNNANIDVILDGVRAIGQRGDTDLVKDIIDRVVESGEIKLGTHASQSLANYLMFDMGGKDVLLRRYGKYINLETARVYNEGQSSGKRINDTLSFREYIRGEYVDYVDPDGTVHMGKSKRAAAKLLEGTSLDEIERTGYGVIDASIRKAYTNEDGTVDLEGFKRSREEIQKSLMPAFISANLKYLSGSEQIQNAAEFLTGLHQKNGKFEKRWEDSNDVLFGLDPEYFQKQTNIYLTAQTPTQILTLRTDLFNPIKELLADEREQELRASDSLPEGYDSLEEKDKKIARDELAKQKFQELLDSKGKLETIYRSRTSGAANNAKDIIRDFLDFNDEGKITSFLKKRRKDRMVRQQIYEETHGDTPSSLPTIFDESDRQYFQDRMFSLFDEDPDSVDFFDKSISLVRNDFGQEYIARRYEEFRTDHPDATNSDLLSVISELLANPENY
ncbi:hypothetical protein IKG02_01520 [Candidatus Saccharibacteria bacterium]|nr:hypothetical protein [Candidatus Saccharibacteria bacterium]